MQRPIELLPNSGRESRDAAAHRAAMQRPIEPLPNSGPKSRDAAAHRAAAKPRPREPRCSGLRAAAKQRPREPLTQRSGGPVSRNAQRPKEPQAANRRNGGPVSRCHGVKKGGPKSRSDPRSRSSSHRHLTLSRTSQPSQFANAPFSSDNRGRRASSRRSRPTRTTWSIKASWSTTMPISRIPVPTT